MRTPFFIWRAPPSRHVAIGLVALSAAACSDTPTTPHPLKRTPVPSLFADSVLTMAIDRGQLALADLARARQRRRGTSDDSLLERQAALLSKRIEGWRLRAAHGGGLSRDEIESGALMEGIIVDDETWSRVELTGWGDTPVVTVMTMLSTPALIIGTNTSGSVTIKRQTYPVSASFLDYGWYAWNQFHPKEVDCTKAGAYMVLGTWHYANWFFGGITSSTGYAHTVASDSCPSVAPIPHFRLSAQGNTGEDDSEVFGVSAPKGEIVGVTLTAFNVQFDAPIKTYRWFRNGVKFAEGPSALLWVSENNTGVRLEVTDENGLKGTADASIGMKYTDGTVPPPPPPPPKPPEEEQPPTAGNDPSTPHNEPEPPPPEPVARYTCEDVFEKMRSTWGTSSWEYWEYLGRECGWVDSFNRLPNSGPLTLQPRQHLITPVPKVVRRP